MLFSCNIVDAVKIVQGWISFKLQKPGVCLSRRPIGGDSALASTIENVTVYVQQ